MPSDPGEPIELYRARGGSEAQELLARLDEAGITARIDNDLLNGIVGEVPAGWVTAPRLLVVASQFEVARTILAEFLEAAIEPEWAKDGQVRCLACRAVMGEAEICPACGWTFHSTESEG